MLKSFLFALIALFFTNCQGQNPRLPDPPLPIEKFKTLAFEPPAPDILAALRIPFLDGDRFGIADWEGKILLGPQFEDIEMMDRDLPFFKAKKNGKWSLYSLDGRQILPFSVGTPYELILDWQRAGFRFDENGVHIERLMTKIKDPRPAIFTDPSGVEKTDFRYFFLKEKTRPPYRSWFMPDHIFFIRSTRDQWMMSGFTSDFQYGNLKIMDEKGRFGLLDCDGNLLQSPIRNCATIGNADKILILNDNDRIALRDVKKGWQTDFLFNNVETTPEPGLFLGEFYQKGKPTRLFQIDSTGRVSPIEGMTKMEWLEKTSKSTQTTNPYQILWDTSRAILTDLQTGKVIFQIAHGRIGHAGSGLFEVEKDKKRGWLRSDGQLLLPIEYDQLICIWKDRRMIAIKNGLAGLFDLDTGREILPVEWPYLNRGGFAHGRSVGVVIRSGKNFVWLTKNLEVMLQQGPDKPIKKSNFRLSENTPPAAVADYEKVVMPELITSLIPMEGPGWLHIFRCDGPHVTSIETGSSVIEQVFFSHHEQYLDTGNDHFTGFVKVRLGIGKSYYVRMSDGKTFKK